jgi:hypothetical protein
VHRRQGNGSVKLGSADAEAPEFRSPVFCGADPPGGCAFMVTSIPMNLLCRNLGVKRASVAKLVDLPKKELSDCL